MLGLWLGFWVRVDFRVRVGVRIRVNLTLTKTLKLNPNLLSYWECCRNMVRKKTACRVHSAARSPLLSGCHVHPPEQWHCRQHLQQLCQIGPTCVPAGEQQRLGKQVFHGGDSLSDVATGRVCSVQLLLKASSSRLRYPWKISGRFGVSVTGVKSTCFTSYF